MTVAQAPLEGPAVVYRLYDGDGRLLYVGVARDPQERFKEHRRRDWWSEVAAKTFTEYTDRADALDAERRAIVAEDPIHNRFGKPRLNVGTAVVQIRDFPDDLHRDMRIAAATARTSRRDFVIEAVREKVAREKAS